MLISINPVLTHTSLPCARLADQELQAFRLTNMAHNHQMKVRLTANRLSRATSEFSNHAALLEAALVLTLRMGPPDVTCSSHAVHMMYICHVRESHSGFGVEKQG